MPETSPTITKQNQLFRLSLHPNLTCAFSSRRLKNMSFSYGDTGHSLENRKDFLKELGIDYNHLVCAKQVHGNNVRYAQEEDTGKGALSYDNSIPDTDGFITDKKNLPLAIFTADCLSIFLYDPLTPAVGLIHAGWRSTKENITTEAVQLMKYHFNTRTEDLHVGFGPAIRECCYEIEDEKNNRYYLDLAGINKKQLLTSGIKEINIFDSKICTSCQNEEFFSYRKEGKACGRIMSVTMLR